MLSELDERCESSRSVVRAHRVVSELTECCQNSQSVVTAHGMLSYHRTYSWNMVSMVFQLCKRYPANKKKACQK